MLHHSHDAFSQIPLMILATAIGFVFWAEKRRVIFLLQGVLGLIATGALIWRAFNP